MFPRWLSWIFLLGMGYVIFSASTGTHSIAPKPAESIVPAITPETYPALAELTDVERWKRKLNPDYAAKVNCSIEARPPKNGLVFKAVVEDKGAAEGAALCGQTIRIALSIWDASGARAYTGTLALDLGSRELAAGVDAGLLGITVGETRSLTLPPYAMARAKQSHAPAAALKALAGDQVAFVSAKRLE